MYSPSPYSLNTVDNFQKSATQKTQTISTQAKGTTPNSTNMTNYACVSNILRCIYQGYVNPLISWHRTW